MTPPAEPAAPPTRRKILLVDDSAVTHMWIGMILNESEYEMVSARDGVEGVERALAELPITRPVDGLELLSRVRSLLGE